MRISMAISYSLRCVTHTGSSSYHYASWDIRLPPISDFIVNFITPPISGSLHTKSTRRDADLMPTDYRRLAGQTENTSLTATTPYALITPLMRAGWSAHAQVPSRNYQP